MLAFALRRILAAIPIVIAISFVVFWIVWMSPTDFSINDALGALGDLDATRLASTVLAEGARC